ncbi:tetratricopeptide repeat protein [Gaetbulibacter aestuarii]|uniref:Tetratricopeptide repeat protein n=1 Tax=Gaetbulibacter aestuarii TaxID=1502358 RepID=A0ABW7MYV5_9FLAO
MKSSLFLGLLLLFFSCKEQEKHDYLGVVHLDVTGNDAAKKHFEKGLLLLHSFEYQDAREAFLEAQAADPSMPMAYWGEAMTYNHSLWSEQDYDAGLATLEKLKNINVPTSLNSLESDLIKGLDLLYQPKTAKNDRDVAYKDYMKILHDKYPSNHEVAAFYALSLLGSVAEGRNDSIYGMGAKIAQGILKENAQHPGALHYLIHSYDDPQHAFMALDAADAYAQVAPDASHALHMPSHIYVALGMWDKVVQSNIDSYQASLHRMEAKNLDNNARGYHAYHWLEYGYLQKNQVEEAEKMVYDMQKYCSETPSGVARVHLMFLKGTFLAETDLWDHDIASIPVDVSGLNIGVRAQNYFIEGMRAFKTDKVEDLKIAIDSLSYEIKKESLLADNLSKGFAVCSSASRSLPTQSDVNEAKIMLLQLQGLQAWQENDPEQAEAHFKNSVTLHEQMSYSYGPPFIQKPPMEFYAEFLMEQNRPAEALELYQKALKRGTKRLLPLRGINEAAIMLGDNNLIASSLEDLQNI